MEPVSRTTLQLVIEGDMAAFNELSSAPWQEVERLAKDDALILSRDAIARVLHRLQRREITGEEAQRWASFVRRGYLPNALAGQTITPLGIEYETQFEDAIVEVVARLDSIGDLVDGEVPTEQETNDLLALLAP